MNSGNLDEQLLSKSKRNKYNELNTSSLNIDNLEKSNRISSMKEKKVNYISAHRVLEDHSYKRLSYESLLINDMNMGPIREVSKEHLEMTMIRESMAEVNHRSNSEDTI